RAGMEVQLCPVTGLRLPQPYQDARVQPGVFLRRCSTVAHGCPALQAQVVSPALERRYPEGLALHTFEQRLHDWEVLLDELFLQADGVRGHDDAFAATQGVQRCRNEVR